VWKNTEDEILKAAVMKYGLNQWARISSLLVRKSAKQCKARWYEWLDPAIRKTEWTREEDEKLLHLAKLMPTQWRTIAPIVGRTPAQCLERYEKLLDMAAGKEGGYDARDDPRRLRPGEIDPNPEGKPARPDPVDMDEDEKEMLSEARARLANTRGKKAKRKAREKQLEEARRLAALQKTRELKAAGIEVREKAKRGGGVDYAKEVPFEHRPAPGFFDTGDEAALTREMREEFRPVTKDELEGRQRRDIEADFVKKDAAAAKAADRLRPPPSAARALAAEDAQAPRRRGRMMLPAPQVSDAELEAIARSGAGAMDVDGAAALGDAGNAATRALLGDYATPSRLPGPVRTPARTPAGGAGGSRVMQEAQNLARLQQGQTPLLGGENPELHPSDFSGVTPRNAAAATPNPLAAAAPGATPSRAFGVAGLPGATPSLLLGATPGRGGGAGLPGATPTPMRDALGLNEPESQRGAAASRREESARLAAMRSELRAGLGGLPAPRNEYQIVAPELGPDDMDADGAAPGAPGLEEDAAERDARLAAAAVAAAEAELRKRSTALRRGLPRPAALDALPAPRPDAEAAALPALELAAELVAREALALLEHDAAKFPLGGAGKKGHPAAAAAAAAHAALEEFPEVDLAAAAGLLDAETAAVRGAMGHASTPAAEYASAWEGVAADIVFAPGAQRYVRAVALAPAERLAALQADFEGVRKEMEREAKRAAKLEAKAGLVTGGLAARQERLRGDAEAGARELEAAGTELRCFQALHEQEQRAAPDRLEALGALVAAQAAREAALQARYGAARLARDDAVRALRA
jgi:pre-mRNA-splicing factor CDC5/CEF1